MNPSPSSTRSPTPSPTKHGNRVYHSNYWHTDHTNRPEPPSYTALYALELPKSGGGNTGIANMRAAYEALPAAMKARIDGLETVNVFQGSASKKKSARYGVSARSIEDKPVIHPLIRTHPANGTKAIYMHQGKVEQFVGMTPEDSQALIEELLDTAIRPEFIYRHKWRLGDLLIWDDRSTMHHGLRGLRPERDAHALSPADQGRPPLLTIEPAIMPAAFSAICG